jgi:hypothetical protein
VQLPPGTLVTKIYFFFVNKLNFILKQHTQTQDFKLMLCDCHSVYLGGGGRPRLICSTTKYPWLCKISCFPFNIYTYIYIYINISNILAAVIQL